MRVVGVLQKHSKSSSKVMSLILTYDTEVHEAHDSDVPPQDDETTMITQMTLGPMEMNDAKCELQRRSLAFLRC